MSGGAARTYTRGLFRGATKMGETGLACAMAVMLGLPAEDPDRALKRFGGAEDVMCNWRLTVPYHDWAMNHYVIPADDPFPSRWRAWCDAGRADADHVFHVYEWMRRAVNPYTAGDRGGALNHARNLIGERDYWAGRLPPVPRVPK